MAAHRRSSDSATWACPWRATCSRPAIGGRLRRRRVGARGGGAGGAGRPTRPPTRPPARSCVITMLPEGRHVREVYLGDGRHHRPRRARRPADRLLDDRRRTAPARSHAAARERGPRDARRAGLRRRRRGRDADAHLHGRRQRAGRRARRPILERMGKAVVHTGPAGNGQAAKICNNMILGDLDDRRVRGVRPGRAARARRRQAVRGQQPVVRPVLVADQLLPGAGPGAELAGQPGLPGRLHRRHDGQGPAAGPGRGAERGRADPAGRRRRAALYALFANRGHGGWTSRRSSR